MFFDDALRMGPKGKIVAGVGVVVFVLLHNHVLSCAFSLLESCSNNVAEYNALVISLQLAQQMEMRYLEAYNDSNGLPTKSRESMRLVMKI